MQRHLKSTDIPRRDGAVVTRARDLSLFKLVAAMSAKQENVGVGGDFDSIGVLLIEEGVSIAVAIESGLRQSGFNVWSSPSYVEGLELYHSIFSDVDIVILDVTQDLFNARYAIHLVRRINADVNICAIADALSRQELADLLEPRCTCILGKPLPHINTIADRLWLLAASNTPGKAR